MRRVLLAVLILVSLASAQKRPFTFEDMMSLKRVGDPVISPDGKWVAFSAVEVNLAENTRKSHLWVVPLAGGDSRRIADDKAGESRPRFTPDGKRLSFLSAKDGGTQVWVQDFDAATGALTGEARKITSISTEADGQTWSPDGKWLLFTSSVYPECNAGVSPATANSGRAVAGETPALPSFDACNKQKDEEQAKSKVKARVFRHLLYRHWTAYTGDKRTHIFIQAVSEPTSANTGQTWGTARDLTPGDHDAPPFSLGGADDYAFSPDSQEVAYVTNLDEVEATSTNKDIFVVPVAGGTPKKISTSPGSDGSPRYSPDGKYIAWLMQETPGYESDRFQLVLFDRKTGQITSLTRDFDKWVGSFAWAASPQVKGTVRVYDRIYISAEETGGSPIFLVPVPHPGIVDRSTGTATTLSDTATQEWFARNKVQTAPSIQRLISGHNDDVTVVDNGTLLFSRVSAQAPTELFTADLTTVSACSDGRCDSHESKQLTHLNDSVLSQISMSPLESFWFTGAAKAKVQGFLVKPPNFNAKQKYPVKFLIHGGPEGAWGDSWTYRWNAELFAANGYVVVMINPTGSTGYGQAFTQAIQNDWGGRPYEDLMKGLDYALAHYPYMDGNRVCAMGASYGGYMANWVLGHTTRFKCIVSHDGIFNTIAAYGDTEELWFPEWEFKGTPWTSKAIYDKWSPSNYVKNFKTPTLVVHSQLDYRLDVSEGFQLFTALQKMKVPSKMLYFPDEGHWILKPQNSQLWYKTVNDWVDQWVKK
jgi:dipeptidyl aminopeptidase/acylaminoacyl peptidase